MNRAMGPVLMFAGVAMLLSVWAIYEPPAQDQGELPPVTQTPELPAGEDDRAADIPELEPDFSVIPELTRAPAPEPEPERVTFQTMPETIRIPAIDVDHPLVAVGLNPDGSMEIPHDVNELGWYDVQGVLPGDDGTAVLAGHVDSRAQGPGAFYDLRHLDVGEAITMSGDEGQQEWVVTARRTYDKNDIPIEDIFIDHGEPRLVLVTCGGTFDRTSRSYTDNIVIYAELA